MIERLYERDEWKLAAVLGRADRPRARSWWTLLVLRGLLPALLAIGMGVLVRRGSYPGTAGPGERLCPGPERRADSQTPRDF